ncbi:MAG: cytochrome C [Vulcanimicrobiaceae bacterium]
MSALRMRIAIVLVSLGLLAACGPIVRASAASRPYVRAGSTLDAGRYLVIAGGCNDCHTPGWDQSQGRLPESKWLMGSDVGFRGPWGTSFPANLRLFVAHISEAEWLHLVRAGTGNPPMPWTNLHALSTRDARAIYAFIKALGPAGAEAAAYVPPNREPTEPYILFEPQQPARRP